MEGGEAMKRGRNLASSVSGLVHGLGLSFRQLCRHDNLFGTSTSVNSVLSRRAQPQGGGTRGVGFGIHGWALGSAIE